MRPLSKLSVVVCSLAIVAAWSSAARAQCVNPERGVVLSTPAAPIPVRTAGANVLGYELHVLNAGASEVEIDSVDVLDVSSGTAERRLLHETRSELGKNARRIGIRGTQPKALVPGVRTVVFFWIRIDTLAPLPRAIVHRVTLRSREGCRFTLSGDTLSLEPPTRRVVAPPVVPGIWWMGLGPSNDSEHRRALIRVGTDTTPHLAQRFAIDWVMIGPDEEYMRNGGKRNEDYYGYRQPVLAAAPGRVVLTNDGVPDNEPGENSRAVPMTVATAVGNWVLVELEPHVFATYAHLVPGSVRVRPGQLVQAGDTLGLIGNSGNSDAPHLHFHIVTAPDSSMATLRGEGIPFLLDRFDVVGHDPELESRHAMMTPKGSYVRALPAEGDVIRVKRNAAEDERGQVFRAPPALSQTLAIPPREARTFVDSIRTALSLPGLVVIVARSEGAAEVIVTGVRKSGTADSIQVTDRMHLGSNGKAITATMIGALVEQGRLTFETTLAEAFPDLASAMRAEYRGVTVRQLLGHSAGIRQYTDLGEFGSFMRPTADTVAQRRAFAARVLSEKPLFAPGTKHTYSNAGVALAGMVAERITGQPYEKLVDSLVFRPLGGRARFGNPGTDTAPQPFGHTRGRGNQARLVDPRDVEYVVPAVIAAAGDASVTLPDYGKFLQMHLRGMRGIDGVLKAATIRELHTAIAPLDSGTKFGAGWGFAITKDGFETHGHTGSAGAYIAIAAIQPTRDFAIAILTNIGGDDDVLPEVAKLRPIVTQRLAPR